MIFIICYPIAIFKIIMIIIDDVFSIDIGVEPARVAGLIG